MNLEEFVGRLRGVRKNGTGKYMACCPAHNDSDPSMAIGESKTGKILLHCYAGCSALDIVQSLGLRLEDLFPDAYEEEPFAWAKREIAKREKLKQDISYAKSFLKILTAHLKQGKTVSERDIAKGKQLKAFLAAQGVI